MLYKFFNKRQKCAWHLSLPSYLEDPPIQRIQNKSCRKIHLNFRKTAKFLLPASKFSCKDKGKVIHRSGQPTRTDSFGVPKTHIPDDFPGNHSSPGLTDFCSGNPETVSSWNFWCGNLVRISLPGFHIPRQPWSQSHVPKVLKGKRLFIKKNREEEKREKSKQIFFFSTVDLMILKRESSNSVFI